MEVKKTMLVCEYKGEIISYGLMWRYDEFYYIEIKDKFPKSFNSLEEIHAWFDENPCWRVA